MRRGPVMADSCPGFAVDLAGEFGICKHCGKHRSQHDKAGDGGGGPEETGTGRQTDHPDAALDAGVLDHTAAQHVEVRVRKLEDDKRRLQEQVVRLTQANADCVRRDTTAESERTRMLAREKLAAEERTAAAIAELQRAKDRARDCEGQALLREQLLSDKVKQQAAAMGELHAAVLAQKATTDHLAFPLYWDAFPEGQVHLEVELIGAAAGTELAVERDRVLQRFQAQGAPSVAVSLKRIQDIPFWQRYAAHREHLRLKRGNANERGAPETGCNHLYHGAKQNVQAVIDTGPMARFSRQGGGHPGTWTHEQASYSCGNGFAPTRQVFACRASVGTAGADRSCDCFGNGGGVFVFWVDSAIYTEYLIQW